MRDPQQAEMFRRCLERKISRGRAIFTFRCVDCIAIFRGTWQMAHERGWRKVWRRGSQSGVREQQDQCPDCRGVPSVRT